MDNEIDALKKNQTWILVERKAYQNILTCKWVYKFKKDDKGNLVHHKARQMIVCTRQCDGIDYSETFAPMIKPTTI